MPYVALKPTDQVLDVGCGTGTLLEWLYPKIGHYWGTDFSLDCIAFARDRQASLQIENASFEHGDVVEFCAKHAQSSAHKFDVVLTFAFSGYLSDEEFAKVYRAIRASMSDHGRLYLYIVNREFFLEYFKKWGLVKRPPAYYPHMRSGEENQRLLLEAGFRSVELRHLPHYNVLRFFDVLSSLPLVGKFFRSHVLLTATK